MFNMVVVSVLERRLNATCLSNDVNDVMDVLNWTSVAFIQEINEGKMFGGFP